jgi:hypothetical protein
MKRTLFLILVCFGVSLFGNEPNLKEKIEYLKTTFADDSVYYSQERIEQNYINLRKDVESIPKHLQDTTEVVNKLKNSYNEGRK